MRRAAVACGVFWLVSALFLGIGAIAANPATDAEGGFVGRIGDERAAAGLAGFRVAPDLVEVARRHADEMRRQQRLHHNPRLGDDVQGWQSVGENVGVGPTVEAIHQKFMESPTHRDNILSGRYTEVGVGVVADGPDLWVVQVFRLPRASEPAGTAASEPSSPPPSSPPSDSGSGSGSNGQTAPTPAPPEPRPAGPSGSPAVGAVRAAANGSPATAAPSTSAPTPNTTSGPAPTVLVPAVEVPTSLVESAPTTAASTPSVEAPQTAPSPGGASTVVEADGRTVGERQVTGPVALAATLLLGVVAALAIHVGGGRVRAVAATTSGRRPSLLDVWELALAG